jgi:GntR family transcriptional repressor for pyruvate dehydrogenase complex
LKPLIRTKLADELAERIAQLIRSGRYCPGDRLPSIAAMAKQFGVGHPTLREALKKLESIGVLDIRHGSGVYVGRHPDMIVVSNPVYSGVASKQVVLDLIQARLAIEVATVSLAAERASRSSIEAMEALLEEAGRNLGDDALLSASNMAFHREIARASGNTVFAQLLDVLTTLFQNEQRVILDVHGSREVDHQEHREILDAIRIHDPVAARERMAAHLGGVRDKMELWEPDRLPVTVP